MNRAQQKLVCAGAAVAALLGYAAVRELNKPGLNCKDQIYAFADRRDRWVTIKSRVCEE
jgi:hypothetical protein